MSTVASCAAITVVGFVIFNLFVSYMARKEVADYYELQVSKAAHPAGKLLNRQIDRN